MDPAGRINVFEGLRGYLALWVLIGHALYACGRWGPADDGLPEGACPTTAVEVFVILSGFVITRLLLEREGYRPFLLRRAFRLYPAYLVALAIAFLTSHLALSAWQHLPFPSPHQPDEVRFMTLSVQHPWQELASHLLMLQAVLNTDHALSILGPAWSLSLEWQFYLLAPLIVAGLRAPASRPVLFGIGAVLCFLSHKSLAEFTLMRWSYAFCLGMLSCFLFREERLRPLLRGVSSWYLLALLVLMICFSHKYAIGFDIWVFACGAALTGGVAGSLFTNRPALWLGRISYSMYLIHMPILNLVLFGLERSGGAPARMPFTIALVGTTLFGSVLAGWLMSEWVEQPGIRLGRRLMNRATPIRALRYSPY